MDNVKEMNASFTYEEISTSLLPIERFALSWFFIKTKNTFLEILTYPGGYIHKDMGIVYEMQIVRMLSSDPMFGFDTINAALQPELDLLSTSLSPLSDASIPIENNHNFKEFKSDLRISAGIPRKNSLRFYIHRYLDDFKFSLKSLRINKKCYCDTISKQNTEYKKFPSRQKTVVSYSVERQTLEMDKYRVDKKHPILLPIGFQLKGRGLSWDGKRSYLREEKPSDKPFQIQRSVPVSKAISSYYQYVSIEKFKKEYHLPFRIDFVPPECILLGEFCDALEPIILEIKANDDPAFKLAYQLMGADYSLPGSAVQLEFQVLPDSYLKIANAAEKLYPGTESFLDDFVKWLENQRSAWLMNFKNSPSKCEGYLPECPNCPKRLNCDDAKDFPDIPSLLFKEIYARIHKACQLKKYTHSGEAITPMPANIECVTTDLTEKFFAISNARGAKTMAAFGIAILDSGSTITESDLLEKVREMLDKEENWGSVSNIRHAKSILRKCGAKFKEQNATNNVICCTNMPTELATLMRGIVQGKIKDPRKE